MIPQIEVIEFLFENLTTLNLNVQNSHGLSAMHYACIVGDLKLVELLMDKGCSCNLLNLSGMSPLHYAASNGRHNICALFFNRDAAGVDFLLEDEDGNTAIDSALSSGYKELASRLAFFSYLQLKTKRIYSLIIKSDE